MSVDAGGVSVDWCSEAGTLDLGVGAHQRASVEDQLRGGSSAGSRVERGPGDAGPRGTRRAVCTSQLRHSITSPPPAAESVTGSTNSCH